MRTNINCGYGVFEIVRCDYSPHFPVRVNARYHFSVHKSVEDAVNYLVDRFGSDVVYTIN